MASEDPNSSASSGFELKTAQLEALVRSTYAWLMRPRVRLTLVGGLLLLLGTLIVTSSVWTLPLVIVGALMVVVAWIGHRLDGRFALQWGDGGTELVLRATIKPAAVRPLELAPPSTPAEPLADRPSEIIEGEAHTVEIDVAELKALIAAAESAEPRSASATDIRIRAVRDEPRSAEAAG